MVKSRNFILSLMTVESRLVFGYLAPTMCESGIYEHDWVVLGT